MNRFIIAASALMITTGLGVAADIALQGGLEAPGGMGEVDAQVRDIFRRYPTGGPGMISAIEFLLADDHVCRCPGIAGAVVDAARRGTVEQKIAAGQALADAQTALALNPNTLACANTIGNAAGARTRKRWPPTGPKLRMPPPAKAEWAASRPAVLAAAGLVARVAG